MPQRDREQRLTRAEKLAGVEQQKAQAKTGIATWHEVPEWSVLPKEITGGVNCSYLHDPRPLDQPDIPYEQYAAEMDRRLEADPYPDWETAAEMNRRHQDDPDWKPLPEDEPPHPSVRPWEHSYQISLAMRRYVYPPSKPKPKKVEPVDAPEQVALDDEIEF